MSKQKYEKKNRYYKKFSKLSPVLMWLEMETIVANHLRDACVLPFFKQKNAKTLRNGNFLLIFFFKLSYR